MGKYQWERGELIEGTYLRYVCKAGYRGKHRYIFAKCDLCETIKEIRVDSITSGKTKSCGCYHLEMLDSGKLTALSLRHREEKPYLSTKGGRNWDGNMILISIHRRNIKFLKDKTIYDLLIEYEEKGGNK